MIVQTPASKVIIFSTAFAAAIAINITGCVKRVTPASVTPVYAATLQANAVSPLGMVNPFLCSTNAAKLTCIATVDVNFQRGMQWVKVSRGYQVIFDKLSGQGTGILWFGCAAANTCDGFFIFGSDTINTVPVEPARYWSTKGTDYVGTVPTGSLPIIELSWQGEGLYTMIDRWSGPSASPVLKPGSGIILTCIKDTCTISTKP